MTQTWTAKHELEVGAQLGEGPCWDPAESVLWWIDVKGKRLHRYQPPTSATPDGNNRSFDLGKQVGTAVLRRSGGLIVALENGIGAYDPETEQLKMLCDPEADRPANRFNDGKCDPRGRLWVGTMEDAEEHMDRGALYSLDTDGSVEKHVEGVGVSNGITWSADGGTLFYIDSPTRKVDAFDFDAEAGTIANRRTVIEIPDGMGYPDGMAIDSEDKLWVALWAGWGVARFDPATGELLGKVEVPVARVSACAFGGTDLKTLYMTTARHGIAPDEPMQPLAGDLFSVELDVRGTLFTPYGG